MNDSYTPARPQPPDETSTVAQATILMRNAHKSEASGLQRAMDRITAFVGWPGFAAVLCLSITGWVAVNLAMSNTGLVPYDHPPFSWLHIAATIAALLLAALIFTTQRREDSLADHRAQLIMELSISNDQKISKVIELLEESRRDNPIIADRVDDVAAQMSSPSDAEAVLVAIKDLPE
jgi:uncharacterized membrane protein